jgi:hypothetical protein
VDLVIEQSVQPPGGQTILAAIQELCTKILGEFNTDELFQQNDAPKDPLASRHWIFTSPVAIMVITILIVVFLLHLEEVLKTWRGSPTMVSSANFAPSAPPNLFIFNRMVASIMVSLN